MKMDKNEIAVSNEIHQPQSHQQPQQQQRQQIIKRVPSWIDRLVNAGIIGGSESNIKQLQEIKNGDCHRKSDILIAKHKEGARKNVMEE